MTMIMSLASPSVAIMEVLLDRVKRRPEAISPPVGKGHNVRLRASTRGPSRYAPIKPVVRVVARHHIPDGWSFAQYRASLIFCQSIRCLQLLGTERVREKLVARPAPRSGERGDVFRTL